MHPSLPSVLLSVLKSAEHLLAEVLLLAARHARWVLLGGLILGLVFHQLAFLTRPGIPFFTALLLMVASFRIGPAGLIGALGQLRQHVVLTVLSQALLPICLIVFLSVFGISGWLVMPLLLVAAAAPISGAPNLVIMLGHKPAPALRQLVVGTALLPLTLIPVLMYLPEIGNVSVVVLTTGKLLLVILGAACVGCALRLLPRWRDLDEQGAAKVDGASAIVMAMAVIGLMSGINEAFSASPSKLLLLLLFAFVLNIGLQVAGSFFWGRYFGAEYDVPMSVISGNRNVALFLTALPVSVTEPLLAFIGCYQFPMYLTPLLMQRLYKQKSQQKRRHLSD